MSPYGDCQAPGCREGEIESSRIVPVQSEPGQAMQCPAPSAKCRPELINGLVNPRGTIVPNGDLRLNFDVGAAHY